MEKRKFLFNSLTGLIGDIAWQVSKEGHEVRYFIKEPKERDLADGFVAKSDNLEKDTEWSDIVIWMTPWARRKSARTSCYGEAGSRG